MLRDFVASNTNELIQRWEAKAAKRYLPLETPPIVNQGMPLFLDHLVAALRLEEMNIDSKKIDIQAVPSMEISRVSYLHGAELLRLGYSIDQVVHDYGDVCQTITEMAAEQQIAISPEDFRVFNHCLDDVIAETVRAFGSVQQGALNKYAETLHQRLNIFSEELQRLIEIALRSHEAIRTSNLGLTGSTGAFLLQTIEELRNLADREFTELNLALDATESPGQLQQSKS